MGLEIFKLDGKVAWIPGGTKGLGLQIANALASVGAAVAVSSRHGDEAATAAQAIASRHGVAARGYAADVTDESAVTAAAGRIAAELGPIDILVNSAGINIRHATRDLSLADWRRVLDTNLTGAFLCSKAVLPSMIERKWGRIIHIASMLGLVGLADRPAYTASKGGLVTLAKTQALEVARHGITVNALCPGPFATEMNLPLLNDPEKYAGFVARLPIGRWGELPEIEGAAIFLASPASSYVTGSTLTIDGGWTAQ